MFRFIKKALPFWNLILTVFLCDGFVTLIGLLPPLFSVVFFDYAFPERDIKVLTIFTAAALAIYFLDFIFSAIIDYLNIYVHQSLDYDITLELFKKIESLPLGIINRMRSGDLSVRLTEDVAAVVRFVVNFFSELTLNILKLAVFLYITLSFDHKVTMLALLSVPIYLIETKFFARKLEAVQTGIQEADSAVMDGIQSKLGNLRTIKAFNQQSKEADELGIRLRSTFLLGIKESIVSIVHAFTNSGTLQIWSAFIGWYLGFEVIRGRLTIGELVALSIYLPLLEGPIRALAGLYRSFRLAHVSAKRVAKVMDIPGEESSGAGLKPINVTGGEIVFDNVTFGYQEGVPAIRNFSLRVSAKGSVAFVGDSGSGKSTIVNLLMKFYAPQSGSITIDGQDIAGVDACSLRESLGTVFQETAVIPGTVMENILYGIKGKSQEDVIKAAKDAHAHDFITSLPDGYDSHVLPQGRNLSGGQQQRLAIARILLRDPKIFVLDEPTSALDPASEFLIQESLNRLIGTRTLIVVAHRLSTIKKIEKIVVMSRGSIAEEGSFEELMERKGDFFRLYSLQFGGFQKFLETFNAEFQRFLRYDQDLTLVMMEIPEYERILAGYHPNVAAGYMEAIDLFIKKQIRVMDMSSIYLANKLVLALPETNASAAMNLLKRLEKAFKGFGFEAEGVIFSATFRAAAVSCKEAHARNGEDLFEVADGSLARLPNGVAFGAYER